MSQCRQVAHIPSSFHQHERNFHVSNKFIQVDTAKIQSFFDIYAKVKTFAFSKNLHIFVAMNTHQKYLIFLLWIIPFTSFGQRNADDFDENELADRFHQQLSFFPQEKIYVHTDKPYYISGERIWFRAYLADAATHIPVSVSRYVYVELINPLDTVVTRIKIRQEDGVYHGYLPIPDDMPEGDYTMRAYTTFMRSQDENYFFTKSVRIGDPQTGTVHTETQFRFESGNMVYATFRFSHFNPSSPLVPKSVKISVNGGKTMNVKVNDDGSAAVNFNLPAASRKRTILLEVMAFQNPYRKFVQIPTLGEDFDVTFYPEGGALIQGVSCKIAFKAMKSNGQSTDVSGKLYDQSGTEINEFTSEHLGMGSFSFLAEKGQTYYAICENSQGQSKRFDLPAAVDRGYSLAVGYVRDRIFVSVQSPDLPDRPELYLLAHTRGSVHFANHWDHEKVLVFRRNQFPSGVLHLILFDANRNPVSERLVFINHQDQMQVSYQADQENFIARSLVKNRVTLTNSDGTPLAGNFSVAVTSDREVTPDSASSILTQLLLASDLRGNIENPAFYFQDNPLSGLSLDLLMLTQGWRRYDISELTQGRFSHPAFPIEIGAEISGTVNSILQGKPVENIEVTIASLKGGYFDNAKTDREGRFYLQGGEMPDSTRFIVHAVQKRGMTKMNLILDRDEFPERTLSAVPPAAMIDENRFAKYADKAELQYINEGGVRIYQLSEVTIKADRKPKKESVYYDTSFANSITEERLEKIVTPDISIVLYQFLGVRLKRNNATGQIIPGDFPPLLLVDDEIVDFDLINDLNFHDIAQIDVLKGAFALTFGKGGLNGVISIFTKHGDMSNNKAQPQFHIRSFMPLGYQQPVVFYAPKYDTPEKRNATIPDLRTTIHWQPVVQTDSLGTASFEFYTADEQTSYTVIIEGLTDNGSIIRQEGKLWRKDE